jgi:hypothetical protein
MISFYRQMLAVVEEGGRLRSPENIKDPSRRAHATDCHFRRNRGITWN